MSKMLCTHCGVVRDNDIHNPHTTSECDKTIAVRQMKALESIAAFLEKIANPIISQDWIWKEDED